MQDIELVGLSQEVLKRFYNLLAVSKSVRLGADSVIRRCRLNVRIAPENGRSGRVCIAGNPWRAASATSCSLRLLRNGSVAIRSAPARR
jgi:hypothetical protein